MGVVEEECKLQLVVYLTKPYDGSSAHTLWYSVREIAGITAAVVRCEGFHSQTWVEGEVAAIGVEAHLPLLGNSFSKAFDDGGPIDAFRADCCSEDESLFLNSVVRQWRCSKSESVLAIAFPPRCDRKGGIKQSLAYYVTRREGQVRAERLPVLLFDCSPNIGLRREPDMRKSGGSGEPVERRWLFSKPRLEAIANGILSHSVSSSGKGVTYVNVSSRFFNICSFLNSFHPLQWIADAIPDECLSPLSVAGGENVSERGSICLAYGGRARLDVSDTGEVVSKDRAREEFDQSLNMGMVTNSKGKVQSGPSHPHTSLLARFVLGMSAMTSVQIIANEGRRRRKWCYDRSESKGDHQTREPFIKVDPLVAILDRLVGSFLSICLLALVAGGVASPIDFSSVFVHVLQNLLLLPFSVSSLFLRYCGNEPFGLKLNAPVSSFFEAIFHSFDQTVKDVQLQSYMGKPFSDEFLLFLAGACFIPLCWSLTAGLSFLLDIIFIVLYPQRFVISTVRRIHKVTLSSLGALFRIFRGKKVNPLMERQDSFFPPTDELFLGVLLFAGILSITPTIVVVVYCINIPLVVVDMIVAMLRRSMLLIPSIPVTLHMPASGVSRIVVDESDIRADEGVGCTEVSLRSRSILTRARFHLSQCLQHATTLTN
mmetsp:Transcript_43561/g.113428  ORF Transcript_43561/g.113428 Transcript_43561/m.113428 type:complete len:655 (-) Transcript_43561:105-2069(-)